MVKHEWVPWTRYAKSSHWEISRKCLNPSCKLPKNGYNSHIRCALCKEYPPLAKLSGHRVLFTFRGTRSLSTIGGPCPNPYCGLMQEIRKAEGYDT